MGPDDDRPDRLGDVELDPELRPADLEPEPERGGRGGPNWPLIWVALILLLAIVGVYFGFFRGRRQALEPAPEPRAEAPAPSAAESAEPQQRPPVELPELDASDAIVRELVNQLADHPRLAEWLAPEELVRRFAAAVDNIAEGRSPRTHLGVLAPKGDFAVVERGGVTVVDPASYRRYDAPTELFTSLEAESVAELYRTLRPLITEAYRDLGYPARRFETALAAAIDELLATPIPSGDVVVLPGVSSYRYADPSLENLSPAQKHLLRMGPENARRVQRKLTEIRDELALER